MAVNGKEGTADPLQLLRDFTIQQKPLKFTAKDNAVDHVTDADTVHFDHHAFPATTATTYSKTGSPDDFYTLVTLIFLLQHEADDYAAYLQACMGADIPMVSVIDKKGVVDYLTGKMTTSASIKVPTAGREKRTRDDVNDSAQADEGLSKKTKHGPGLAVNDIEFVKAVIAREHLLHTKATILRGSKDLSNIRKAGVDVFLNAKKDSASQSKGNGVKKSKSATDSRVKSSRDSKIPIIIVPAAATSLLTLYNIKEFLENQTYVDTHEIREKGIKKPARVIVERKKANGTTVPYHVVDKVDDFKPDDWDRVVCVFTNGAEWQFKGWKWPNPLTIFNNVKGFVPKWHDEKITGHAATWNVLPLNIHRHKRHMDRAVVSGFWDTMDNYLSMVKNHLTF